MAWRRAELTLCSSMFLLLGACSSDDPEPSKSAPTGDPSRRPDGGGPTDDPVVEATCTMRTDMDLSYEERRLVNRQPGKDVPFAREILEASAFDGFEKDFTDALCKDGIAGASSVEAAKELVKQEGTRLWRAAVDRAQGRRLSGSLPAGDDRMLYWARLVMTKTLRGWMPSFALSDAERTELEWELERASRGQYDITLPAGDGHVRIVLSGFDPFTLGDPGATDDDSIRIGNPSGAAALAYDGYEFSLGNGKTGHIETFILPVSYPPFDRGMEEDTLGPWFQPGPSRADMAITMSQGSGYRFKLEEYNGRFRGTFEGNDGVVTCKATGSLLPRSDGCNIHPPARWLGYESMPWQAARPPQFVESTLPIAPMISAMTGTQVPRPPGSQAAPGHAFDVVWGYDYDAFPVCSEPSVDFFYDPVSTTYPPPGNPQPPSASMCARAGSGGDYLSNESAYRATLLRDALGLTIPVGHIHTPIMTRFEPGSSDAITDERFEAYRTAIVHQGRLLIEAAGKAL